MWKEDHFKGEDLIVNRTGHIKISYSLCLWTNTRKKWTQYSGIDFVTVITGRYYRNCYSVRWYKVNVILYFFVMNMLKYQCGISFAQYIR